ncbi:MAG: hypothetical protein ACFFE8_10050 [Candidatus Heimdallarchaeota archaeon]
MRKFGPATFRDNAVLNEHFASNGPLVARGSLSGLSIRVNGPVKVGSNLEITERLRVNGPCTIGGSLKSSDEAHVKINGPLFVEGGVQGGSFRVNGPFKADSANVFAIYVHGTIDIRADLTAADEISIVLGHAKSKKRIRIGGIISAPYVYIKDPGSVVDLIPGLRTMKRLLRRNFFPKSKFKLRNLQIKTDFLVLEDVELVESKIDAKQIENRDREYQD